MLISLRGFLGFDVRTVDFVVGKVEDLYYDEEKWVVRYLVVRSPEREKPVLISPLAIDSVALDQRALNLNISKDQIENGPNIDTNKPISRILEERYFSYYRWPFYWTGSGLWGGGPAPTMEDKPYPFWALEDKELSNEVDTHLRASREVIGYSIHSSDGNFGSVEDLVIDVSEWSIRYLVIDTVQWWPSPLVLISPEWVKEIDWFLKEIRVDHSEKEIKESPRFDPDKPVNREYEERLYDYYGRPKYWKSEEAKQNRPRKVVNKAA